MAKMGSAAKRAAQSTLENGETKQRVFLTGIPLGKAIVDQLFKLMTKANRDPKLRKVRGHLLTCISDCEVELERIATDETVAEIKAGEYDASEV